MIQKMRLGTEKDSYLPVFVQADDRFKPCIVIGSTGTGKSESLLNIWKGDSYSPVAKILVDPSGTLARQAYSSINGKAKYLSIDHPIGINPLRSPYRPFQIADMVTETID